MDILLTSNQENAKKSIMEWFLNLDTQVFVLSGYAGTGKTFLLRHVVCDCLALEPEKQVAFVAPTGKAASILIRSGTPASTIHSLIYKMDDEAFDVDDEGEILRERLKFIKRDQLASDYKLIVIDETSMVSDELMRDLLSFGVKCLFCGDNAQLPPVNGNSSLLDRPNCLLTEIMRQELDNPIVTLATLARGGEFIPFGNYGEIAAVVAREDFTGETRKRILLKADQIICGRNKTRTALNNEIRRYKGLSDSPLPQENEKVICTLNNWGRTIDGEGRFHLVNGIIGFCSNVEEKSDGLGTLSFRAEFLEHTIHKVPFDEGIFIDGKCYHGYGELAVKMENGLVVSENNFAALHNNKAEGEEMISRFEFAYAITCHKAQGSEFDFVVVFDESRVFGQDAPRWLYTAVTRAKKKLLIVR